MRTVKLSPRHRNDGNRGGRRARGWIISSGSLLGWQADEHMVGDGVPGVVNADEKQQERNRSDRKQSLAFIGRGGERREDERSVRDKREQHVKQPIFELRSVGGLRAHPAGHDHRVCRAGHADETPKDGFRRDAVPRGAQKRREKQHHTEMHDRGGRERCAGFRGTRGRPLRNQGHDDELQADQRARSGPDDHVEALPFGEFGHGFDPLKFLPSYPDINVEIHVDYGFVDIVALRYDAGVRTGGQVAKDMIAVRIAPDMCMAVVGSPSYFGKRPLPKKPQDLTEHNCINVRMPTYGGLYAWEFEKGKRELKVRVNGQLVVNTIKQRLDAALAGAGLAYMVEDVVQPYVAQRKLVRVLEDWCAPFPGYHLYFPSRRQSSPAFNVLVEALRYRN